MNELIEQEVLDAKEVSTNESGRVVVESDIDLRDSLSPSFHDEVAQLLSNLGVIVESQWRPAGLATEKRFYTGPVLVIKAVTGNQDVTGPKLAEAVRSLIPDALRAQTRVWCPFLHKDVCNETLVFDVAVAGAPAVLFEFADEDEMKTISEPTDPKERIMTVLNGHGLHIESFVTTPSDPGWGDLGNPVFVIKTNLQPTEAPWTYDPVAQSGLVEFCARVKRDLEEITHQDVTFASKFAMEKGAWNITWLTDEHGKMESTGDADLDAELAKELTSDKVDRALIEDILSRYGVRLLPGDRQGTGFDIPNQPDIIPNTYHMFRGQWKPKVLWHEGSSQLGTDLRNDISAQCGVAPKDIFFYIDFASGEVEVAVPRKNLQTESELDSEAEDAKEVGEIPADRDVMPSGVEGWQSRLQNAYDSFEEFASYSDIYGLAERLGFETAQEAWEANPIIRGSVNPGDYGVVESAGDKPPWYDPNAGAQKVAHDVEGAPVKIGQIVRVTSVDEAEEGTDWAKLVGQEGKVVHLEYSCGCGQSYPEDPMIGVEFSDGTVHEFWAEELGTETNEAIRAYHASPNKFKKFDLSKEGAHFGSREQASNVRKHGLKEPVAYDLEVKNPLRLHDIGVWNNFNNLHSVLSVGDHITPEQADAAWAAWLRSDQEGWEALKAALEQNGYDSIVYQNEQEGPGDSYLVFRDGQIKRIKENDEGDFKDLWVDSPSLSHTFTFVFDFGAGEGTQEWVWTVPIEMMPPVGPDGDLEPVLDFVREYARKHMPDTPPDDWDFLVDIKPANPENLAELLREDLNDDVVAAAKEACKEPSDEQKEAGNYQKGHIVIHGLDISIENCKGSMRRGKDKGGKEWEVKLPAHYGYIKGTEGKDKDHIDVFIGEKPESEKVFVVNQNKLDGGFDEHKVLLGFEERADAIQHYDDAYTGGLGPKLRDSVVSTTMEKFKAWLQDGEHKKPFEEVELKESLQERVNISDVFAYLESIRSKLDEARDAAAAREQDEDKKRDILKGHGIYKGSCGHRIQGCRCPQVCAVIEVQAPCRECASKAPIHEFVNKWRSQRIQEATDPEHMFQSREYDCGPTCIKMVANALGVGRQLTLDDIIQVCGSDPTTGTDDKKMEKGLAAAGVPFQVGGARTAEDLATSLNAGNLIILRTLTRGIKHWIVLYRFDGQRFLAQDPWLGPLSYTPEEVVNIWKPRDYFYFEVPRTMEQRVDSYQIATYAMLKALGESQEGGNLLFVNATGEVMPALEKAIVDVFPRYADWVVGYAKSAMDPQLSVVVLDGHEVVGFYLIGRRDVIDGTAGMELMEDLTPYAQKRGVEGVALGVVGSARGRGIGNRLKDYPKHLGVEYVWGLQMRKLGNLKDWLKRRRLVAQSAECFATLEDL